MKIKINGEELELKYGFQAHKQLQKIIKESGKEPADYLSEENYPIIIQVALKHIKDVSIEEIELAIEDLPYSQLTQFIQPYVKYYSPNVLLPNQ